jgi:hypothetical protein
MTVPTAPMPPAAAPIQFDCDHLIVRPDVELPGEAAAISPVVDRVLALTRDVGCAQGREFEIETALREARASAIRRPPPGQCAR